MSFFLPQNPGIDVDSGGGGFTPAEILFLTSIAGQTVYEGMKVFINSSLLPEWAYSATGSATLNYTGSILTSITMSDGRTITLTRTGNKLTSVTDGFKTTTLTYTGSKLTGVSTV